jgi:AcrR family transcriptional regulator
MNEFIGTKDLIVDAFIEMTSSLGYENVSIRDVTKKVGIRPGSLYNHFESKAKLLEYAYDYYSRHLYDTRRPAEELKALIATAGAKEIVDSLVYTFETEDQQKYVRMILITKIVYLRLFQDPIATAIFAGSNKSGADYVTDIIQHGIDIGRIEPDFDKETFAELMVGSMVNLGIKAFADPNYAVGQIAMEGRIMAQLARLLSTALIPQ